MNALVHNLKFITEAFRWGLWPALPLHALILLWSLPGISLAQPHWKPFEEVATGIPGVEFSKIAWADYDGDKRPDLAIQGRVAGGDQLTRLYQNTPSGFVDVSSKLLPDQDLFRVSDGMIAWGDFDGDGKVDLLVTGILGGKNNYNLRLYRNNGPDQMWINRTDAVWHPADPMQQNPPMMYGSAHWIDFFHTNRLDLVLMGQHYSAGRHTAYQTYQKNNGNGNFTRGTANTRVLTNRVPELQYSSSDWADFDHDNDLDLITLGEGPQPDQDYKTALCVKLFKGMPKGGDGVGPNIKYTRDVTSLLPDTPGLKDGAVAWGDYDHDTWPDLIITGRDANDTYHTFVYHNLQGQRFEDVSDQLAALPQLAYSSVAWVDYNNDGRMDLFLTGNSHTAQGDKTVCKLYFSDSKGGFVDVSNLLPNIPGVWHGSAAWADFDQDNLPDLMVTGNDGSGSLITRLYRNQGASLFERTDDLLPGLPPLDRSAHSWGDYNNDGRLDLIITGQQEDKQDPNQTPVSRLYRNLGNHFDDQSTAIKNLPNLKYSSVAWADYDNDGWLDLLLTGNSGEKNISRLYHNENGKLIEQPNQLPGLPGLTHSAVAWGDYDNDGRQDLLIIGGDGNTAITRLYHNTTKGFEGADSLLPNQIGLWRGTVNWADIDRDGKVDLLLTGLGSDGAPHRLLYHNTGSGFEDVSSAWLADMPGIRDGSVAFGDFDGDGWQDLVVTGEAQPLNTEGTNYITRLYLNTTGNFYDISDQASPAFPALGFNSSVAWTDYDNDGKLDLLLTGYTGHGVDMVTKLYHQEVTTSSQFFDRSTILQAPGLTAGGVSWADYDNDGRLDLLLTGFTGKEAVSALYHNLAPVANTPPTAPSGLSSQVLSGGTSVKLTWRTATDAQTPSASLNYNLYVSDTPNGQDIVGPMANQDSGFRRVVQLGNSQPTSYILTGLIADKTYYWSVQAIDGALAGSAFAAEKIFKTSLLGDAQQALQLIEPLYNCQTGAFTFQTTGGDGTPIKFMASGITAWTVNPHHYVSAELRIAADAPTITLVACQSGKEVRYVFDLRAVCPVGDPNLFRLVPPLYDCETGGFSFRTQGGDGSPIEYMAAGITSWTSEPFQIVDTTLRQTADVQPITLVARQNGNEVHYVWDLRAVCPVDQPDSSLGSPQDLNFVDISGILRDVPAVGSSSITWVDYDNDGRLDFLLTGKAAAPITRLYRNTGNGFDDKSDIFIRSLPQLAYSSVAWADFNNDGWADFLLTGLTANNIPITRLYLNGDGTSFQDFSEHIPGNPQVGNGAVAWGDYDNDGWVDFILTGRSATGPFSKLYRNKGGVIGIEEKTDLLPDLPQVQLSAVAWADYDNDGRLDLMLTGNVQNLTTPFVSKLYHNMGQGFVDVTSEKLPDLVGLAAGTIVWNDYDNDGRLDLLLTGTNGNTRYTTRLYRNTENGFEGESHFPGFYLSSAAFGDYDNDGLKDLIITGMTTAGFTSKLYRNSASGFNDVSNQIQSLPQIAMGSAAWADYDNDGKLDLLLTGTTSTGNVLKLYHNSSAVVNTLPSAPAGLSVNQISPNTVVFSWDRSTDAQTPQTGLHYNLYLSDAPPAGYRVSPLADLVSGYRRVVQLGNSQPTSYTLTGLQSKVPYYWSVQAIDGALAGSAFAPLQRLELPAQAGVGIDHEPNVEMRVKVYPNPVSSELNLQIEGIQEQLVRLQLMSLEGRSIQEYIVERPQSTIQERLIVDNLPSGFYLLKVSTARQSVTLKMMKQ